MTPLGGVRLNELALANEEHLLFFVLLVNNQVRTDTDLTARL